MVRAAWENSTSNLLGRCECSEACVATCGEKVVESDVQHRWRNQRLGWRGAAARDLFGEVSNDTEFESRVFNSTCTRLRHAALDPVLVVF